MFVFLEAKCKRDIDLSKRVDSSKKYIMEVFVVV